MIMPEGNFRIHLNVHVRQGPQRRIRSQGSQSWRKEEEGGAWEMVKPEAGWTSQASRRSHGLVNEGPGGEQISVHLHSSCHSNKSFWGILWPTSGQASSLHIRL